MRKMWWLGCVLIPLAGCGVFEEDKDEASDDAEEAEDEQVVTNTETAQMYAELSGKGKDQIVLQQTSNAEFAALVPASAEAILAIKDLDRLASEYSDFLDPDRAGDHELGRGLREANTTLKREIGFDLSDPEDWDGTGVDFDNEWIFVFHDEDLENDPPMSLMIPLTDREAFRSKIDQLARIDGDSVHCTDSGSTQKCSAGARGDRLDFALFDNYMVMAIPSFGHDTEATLDSYLKEGSDRLASRHRFAQIYDSMPGSWNLMMWASDRVMVNGLQEEMEDLPRRQLEDLNAKYGSGEGTGVWGMGISLGLSLEHVEVNFLWGADWLDETVAPYVASSGSDSLAAKLGGEAFAAVRLTQDIGKLMDAVFEQDEEVRRGWEDTRIQLKETMGFDIQSDLIEHLDGNISLIGMNESGMGGVLYLGLKEEAPVERVLKKLIDQFGDGSIRRSTSDAGDTWYVMSTGDFEAGIAVVDGNLLIAGSEKSGLVRTVQSSLGPKGTHDLMDVFGKHGAKAFIDGAPVVAVANIPAVVDLILDNRSLQGEMDRDFVRNLSRGRQLIRTCAGDLLMSGAITGEAIVGVARMESGRGDFSPCIELALEQQ
jgi:hypothetical protein